MMAIGLALLGAMVLGAQQRVVVGTVVDDSTGAPIPRAVVFVYGPLIYATTDSTGRYRFCVAGNDAPTIKAAANGFAPQSRVATLGDTLSSINFRLIGSPVVKNQPVLREISVVGPFVSISPGRAFNPQNGHILVGYCGPGGPCPFNPREVDPGKAAPCR